MNCRAVVGDDPGLGRGEVFAASLQGDFHVVLGHLVFQLPMDDVAAEAVQQAAQVEKRAADIDVSHVYVRMFVRCRGLVEAVAFLAGRAVPPLQQPPPFQDAVDAAGADGGYVGVEHHIAEPAIAFAGIFLMKLYHGFGLLIGQPAFAGHGVVVPVGLAPAAPPIVELAAADADPADEPGCRNLGFGRPFADVIDDFVADFGLCPAAFQVSPRLFFSSMWEAMISAITSSLRASLASRKRFRSASFDDLESVLPAKAAAPFSKKAFCQA